MSERLRKHATTIVVAMVTAAVTAGGPVLAASVADYARNADKVDGKHAVGAGASVDARKGKLVATNTYGRLPNNIIAKAPDANLLDGVDASGFLRRSAKAADSQKLDGYDSTSFIRDLAPGNGLSASVSNGTASIGVAAPVDLSATSGTTPLKVTNAGSGLGAEIASSSSFASLYVANNGTGGGIRSDTSSGGLGSAFTGYNYGTDRYAAEFELVNSANPRAAIYARTAGNGQAIDAEVNSNTNGDALFARTTSSSASSYAGIFVGNVSISGNVSKSSGTFKIDHPLDPERKYLSHSFVESPDMKNLYDGVVTTDAHGYATVQLPDWFDALNRDFRYSLTPIRSFSRATVWEELRDDAFVIRTEDPRVRVSWQVTGIRQDAYAKANPIKVEEEKAPEDVGRYLNPEAFGKSKSKGIMRPNR